MSALARDFREWLEAAERGDLATLAARLDRGMNVNAKGSLSGKMALTSAIKGRRLEAVRFLLDRGADPNMGLVSAVHGRQHETIRLLLDRGADPNLRACEDGFTAMTGAVIVSRSWGDYWHVPCPDPKPLELLVAAGGRFQLLEAILLNDVELARARIDEGADVNEGEGCYHGPLLKIAAELGHVEIVELLLDRGARTEATDDLGQRPLTCAARRGQLEAVRRLLDRGADLNADHEADQSALALAAGSGHRELVEFLLSRGARRGLVDALARNEASLFESLLDEKLRKDPGVDWLDDGRIRLAMLAVAFGNAGAVRLLLDRGAAHLQEERDDHTLLAEAARQGHIEVARLLLDRGADAHAVGKDGMTPLAWAARSGRSEMAELLNRSGTTH